LSDIDSNIRAYVARRLEKYGGGLGQVVDVSRELIGLTYQLSRIVIRISAFVAFPKSSAILKQTHSPRNSNVSIEQL
jgi:hypothetical protein